MKSSLLYKPLPPWVVINSLLPEEEIWTPSFLYKNDTVLSPVIRVLRGRKMHRLQDLMNEFGAALQFSESFGENWHALRESLMYLDEWLKGDAYILIVTNPEEVLIKDEEQIEWLLKVIQEVGDWWSAPVVNNDRFNRPAIPFHVVLQCTVSTLAAVCRRFPGTPTLR